MTRHTRYIDYSYTTSIARTTISRTQVRDGFVFAPRYNQLNSAGNERSDASGMFIPKAREFVSFFGFSNPPLFFDNDADGDGIGDRSDQIRTLGGRRREIISTIEAIENPINVVAYFGHGHDARLLSAGFRNDNHREALADAIASKSQGVGLVVVILYACHSGSRVDGGFAKELWADLLNRGIRSTIFGHETRGRTHSNPNKRRYPGGSYIIEPNSRLWNEWGKALIDSDLWMRFAFMEPHMIERELETRLATEATTSERTRSRRQRRVGPIGLSDN